MAINGLHSKEIPVKIKDLIKESISIGKSINFNRLFEIQLSSEVKAIYSLERNNMSFCSFTFCFAELIKIIQDGLSDT